MNRFITAEQNVQALREMKEADQNYEDYQADLRTKMAELTEPRATEQDIRDDVNADKTPFHLLGKLDHTNRRDFIEHDTCVNDECERLHNETGHHYGCECGECMREYWMLKH